MKTQTLEDLISEYLEEVEKTTNLLELSFGTKNILGLWRSKKIPLRGKLSDDATYELHGVGCRVYISEKCIDFDYGPDGRIDGFESWMTLHLRMRSSKKIQKIH
ncbi:DUF6896 domain-containing protein [Pseudomonas sp. MF6768]|uniref:DUF6896 domain-containing protein n=1 Tax=Pseudomonas sp. MF6768 TaxID=2797532 RepID=UPI003FA7903D